MAAALSWGCTSDPSDDGAGSEGEEGTASEGASGDGSSGEPACTVEDDQLLWANEGMLLAPMELGYADILGIDVARSGTPEMGTVTMSFTTTCDGPLYVWSLVWDAYGGIDPENADSIYVQVDDEEEVAWLYGCETDGPDTLWHWLPVRTWSMNGCEHEPFAVESLPAGDHTVVIRSREGGVGGIDVAAIAGVVVSHVEATDPSTLYEIPVEE